MPLDSVLKARADRRWSVWVFGCGEAGDERREDGRTDRAWVPVEEEAGGCAADAALAGAHAAAGVEFCGAPGGMVTECVHGNVFAAADDGVALWQGLEFRAQGERARHATGEAVR